MSDTEKNKVKKLRLDHVRSNDLFYTSRFKMTKVPLMRGFAQDCDIDAAAMACRDPGGWANAVGMLDSIADKGRKSGFAKALYVIGVHGREDIAKIGISANPLARVSDLQGAHYRKLYLHAIAFSPCRNAMKVEQAVLASPDRLEGEWLGASPENVLIRALECARAAKIALSDGKTYFDDMVLRTRAIARATKFRNAA